ncbi:hypothetical protein O3P69_004097 [Scylla paramamosain]|uniref:Uncharacterized protein n=1 Tax=Scylla paramamosain TaxID=85552 RepID=A0AAW0UHU2_SCYPA
MIFLEAIWRGEELGAARRVPLPAGLEGVPATLACPVPAPSFTHCGDGLVLQLQFLAVHCTQLWFFAEKESLHDKRQSGIHDVRILGCASRPGEQQRGSTATYPARETKGAALRVPPRAGVGDKTTLYIRRSRCSDAPFKRRTHARVRIVVVVGSGGQDRDCLQDLVAACIQGSVGRAAGGSEQANVAATHRQTLIVPPRRAQWLAPARPVNAAASTQSGIQAALRLPHSFITTQLKDRTQCLYFGTRERFSGGL